MSSANSKKPNSNQPGIGQWVSKLLVQATFFVAAECLLNAAGLDTIADYYEFVNGQSEIEIVSHQSFNKPIALINRPDSIG
jgi:hypothetical protein